MARLLKKLEEALPEFANRFAYVLFLWLLPGIFSVFAGFFALWILSDRASSPLWLEVAFNFEAFVPVLYLVFGVWAYAFASSSKKQNRESYGQMRLVLLWVIPLFLLASQILIIIIGWNP